MHATEARHCINSARQMIKRHRNPDGAFFDVVLCTFLSPRSPPQILCCELSKILNIDWRSYKLAFTLGPTQHASPVYRAKSIIDGDDPTAAVRFA